MTLARDAVKLSHKSPESCRLEAAPYAMIELGKKWAMGQVRRDRAVWVPRRERICISSARVRECAGAWPIAPTEPGGCRLLPPSLLPSFPSPSLPSSLLPLKLRDCPVPAQPKHKHVSTALRQCRMSAPRLPWQPIRLLTPSAHSPPAALPSC